MTILREVAKAYLKSKKYAKAIETYEKIMGGDPKNLSGQDYFEMGRAYYFGPKDFVKSDTCFSKVTQSIPTFATAYFWRGKANVQQDPKNEKWLAKPHYEKALELVKPEERAGAKTNVIEACEYLGYYYLTVKDNAKAKEYFTIIKDLDPNNKKQMEFFKSPAGK
jgi:tetratricopeptide (TPR) repeat protein